MSLEFQLGLTQLMEDYSDMQNDVDVNILINTYHNKISTLYNQNILLEAKVQSLEKDWTSEKNALLMKNLELQKKVDELSRSSNKKSSQKFSDAEVE